MNFNTFEDQLCRLASFKAFNLVSVVVETYLVCIVLTSLAIESVLDDFCVIISSGFSLLAQ